MKKYLNCKLAVPYWLLITSWKKLPSNSQGKNQVLKKCQKNLHFDAKIYNRFLSCNSCLRVLQHNFGNSMHSKTVCKYITVKTWVCSITGIIRFNQCSTVKLFNTAALEWGTKQDSQGQKKFMFWIYYGFSCLCCHYISAINLSAEDCNYWP